MLFLTLCEHQSLLPFMLIARFFLWPWVVSLHTGSAEYSAGYFRGLLFRSPEFSLCVALSSLALNSLNSGFLFSPKSQLDLLKSGNAWLYLGSSFLCYIMETLSLPLPLQSGSPHFFSPLLFSPLLSSSLLSLSL